jgi:ubiquinone/menaquinone biosynthesis C-methylase UbiE
MKWGRNEIERLYPILEQLSADLAPVDGKHILVVSSAIGEVAFRLGEMMESGHVTGLEKNPESLELARRAAHEMGLEDMVEFLPTEMEPIPLEDAKYDSVVSESIVYPTTSPTQISQTEMARVMIPGGRIILTKVIVTKPFPDRVREELEIIGLDTLCEATKEDFRTWMVSAGLVNVEVTDLTSTLRSVWEDRRSTDRASSHEAGYAYLLDDPDTCMGEAIFYIYVRGDKPKISR